MRIDTNAAYRFNEDKQMTTVSFSNSLPAGSKAALTVKFQGTLNDKMAGTIIVFYNLRSSEANFM